jgi:hypothetical protein
VRRLCRTACALTFGAFETARENSRPVANDTVTPSPTAEQSSQWHSWHGLLRTCSVPSAIDFIHAVDMRRARTGRKTSKGCATAGSTGAASAFLGFAKAARRPRLESTLSDRASGTTWNEADPVSGPVPDGNRGVCKLRTAQKRRDSPPSRGERYRWNTLAVAPRSQREAYPRDGSSKGLFRSVGFRRIDKLWDERIASSSRVSAPRRRVGDGQVMLLGICQHER